MGKEELKSYYIRLKEPVMARSKTYLRRATPGVTRVEHRDIVKRRFFKVINEIVESGGSIIMTKNDLSYDVSLGKIYFGALLTQTCFQSLSNNPEIVSVVLS